MTIATVTRTTPFQKEKAVLSDRGRAKPCIYYPGTPDTTGINHIQFVPSVFAVASQEADVWFYANNVFNFCCREMKKQQNVNPKHCGIHGSHFQLHDITILGYITGAIINKSRICWCLLGYKNFTWSKTLPYPKVRFLISRDITQLMPVLGNGIKYFYFFNERRFTEESGGLLKWAHTVEKRCSGGKLQECNLTPSLCLLLVSLLFTFPSHTVAVSLVLTQVNRTTWSCRFLGSSLVQFCQPMHHWPIETFVW